MTLTTLVLRNPDPVTVSVSGPEPAVAFAGLMDETTGGGAVCCPPPFPDVEPPPQPPAIVPTPRLRNRSGNRKDFIGDR